MLYITRASGESPRARGVVRLLRVRQRGEHVQRWRARFVRLGARSALSALPLILGCEPVILGYRTLAEGGSGGASGASALGGNSGRGGASSVVGGAAGAGGRTLPPPGGGPSTGGSFGGDAPVGKTSDAGLGADASTPPALGGAPSCNDATERCGPERDSCCATVAVPGGPVWVPGPNGQRVRVNVSSFSLDKYEVTLGRFRELIANYDDWRALGNPQLGAGNHPGIPGSGWQERYDEQLPEDATLLEQTVRECATIPLSTLDLPNTSERVPLNCVSWFEAAAFCAWDGGRLPTFAESMFAAAGGELDRTYPWGNEPTPTRLYALYGCALGQERPECTASYVLPVGSHPAGAGLFEHEDLAGSMTEWMLDGSPYAFTEGCTDCAGLMDAGAAGEPLRYWRGGSWLDSAESLVNDNFMIVEPSLRLHFVGLRCAR